MVRVGAVEPGQGLCPEFVTADDAIVIGVEPIEHAIPKLAAGWWGRRTIGASRWRHQLVPGQLAVVIAITTIERSIGPYRSV